MATRTESRTVSDAQVDPDGLFLEEVFTDRRIGTIRRLTPVTRAGTPDPGRKPVYVGETQVMSNVGALPIVFDIEADSVGEAASKFGGLAKDAIERTMKELQDMRRQAASSILVPQGPVPGVSGPGGGKIQLP